jgi:hypothetical protein
MIPIWYAGEGPAVVIIPIVTGVAYAIPRFWLFSETNYPLTVWEFLLVFLMASIFVILYGRKVNRAVDEEHRAIQEEIRRTGANLQVGPPVYHSLYDGPIEVWGVGGVVLAILGLGICIYQAIAHPSGPHDSVLEEQTAILKEARPLLEGIKDRDSADAAKARLSELQVRMTASIEKEKATPRGAFGSQLTSRANSAAKQNVRDECRRLQGSGSGQRRVEGTDEIVRVWEGFVGRY